MFTGIIAEIGDVAALERKCGITQILLNSKEVIRDVEIGDSISVNGTCLTVVEIKGAAIRFDLSDETLRSTNLGLLRSGDRVNLEASLRPNSRLGGHFVSGHVDDIGRIKSKTQIGDTFKIEIEVSEKILTYLVKKGSVAVDGISLTVVDILSRSFTVVIIPHTAQLTMISFKGPGDIVNIEVDIIGKYVARFLNKRMDRNASFTKLLTEEGFIR